MRVRGAFLLAGLWAGVTFPLAVPASVADPVMPPGAERSPAATAPADPATPAAAGPARPTPYRASTAVEVRLAPPTVTVGEPSLLVADLTPPRVGRALAVEQWDPTSATWVAIAQGSTDKRGHFEHPVDTGAAGVQTYRVAVTGLDPSRQVVSRVVSNTACSPTTPAVDPEATGEVVCLLTRLDRWRKAGLMGVGQQLNVSADPFTGPIDQLGDRRPAVIGFDLEELAQTATYTYPTTDRAIDQLLTLADEGAVLTASWHATNPGSRGPFTDRSWTNLKALLDDTTPAAQRFWADYDEKLALLARFQNGDDGRHQWTPIVFRPFHEANGDFFWWGKPDPKVHRLLWAELQQRAWDAGVHNLVWAYSFNRKTAGVMDPARLLPARIDLGGLDSYDPEKGEANAKDRLWLEGYATIASKDSVPRMALTEVGPHGSRDGSWNPAVVTRTVRAQHLHPAWAMLWFDDGNGRDGVTGKKQIASLDGGIPWLRDCPGGLCLID